VTELEIPVDRGTYALMLQSHVSLSLRIGALGNFTMCPGYYIYVGSAFGPGGLHARISRHIKRSKKQHWHIDYLREHADLEAVWFDSYPAVQEHQWAEVVGRFHGIRVPFPRFGASDCGCASHLFYSATAPSLSAFRCRLESYVDPGVKIWRNEDTAR
jgi:Uri superfamily endonuclease